MSTRDELVSFARHTAHELNNTVAALSMAAELAIDALPEDSDDLSSLLERVQRCAAKIATTLDALPDAAEGWPLED
jgi:signal transduction histidine kinase